MMSYASSQLMRSHLFSPRSPTRFTGHFRRSSVSLHASGRLRQRMHSLPRLYGWFGSPSTRSSLPSFTYSSKPHESWQPGADQWHVR